MNIKTITSRNNPYVKDIAKLSDKKFRDSEMKFCFEGRKLLAEALISRIPLEAIMFTEHALNDEKIRTVLEKASEYAEMYSVTQEVYDKLSFERSPEGVFTVAKALDTVHTACIIYEADRQNERSVILDGIRDPGNLGTVLRTASAFGVQKVILSSDCADVYNSKTVRASMGAVFRTKTVRVSDLPSTVTKIKAKGVCVYSTALSNNAKCLTDVPNADKAVFIIGNEGSGIRPEVMSASDECVIIPMENGTESLNAASAATIILWEQYRQTK